MKHRVEFFEIREFACSCCGRVKVAAALVFWLDVLRRAVGRPLKINSGYRCPAHNVKVGGAASSRHLTGCAADIAKPSSVDYDDLVGLARRFFGGFGGSSDGWEIVTYPSRTYFHLGAPRAYESVLWDGNKIINLFPGE